MLYDLVTDRSRLLRGGSLSVLAGLLWAVSGLSGVALVASVALVWFAVQTPYTVAVGQLLFVVFIADPGWGGFVGVVAFGVLFVPDLIQQWNLPTAALGTLVWGMMTAVLLGSLLIDSILVTAVVLCLGFGLIAYSVHRYELVRFGLVSQTA